MKIDFTKGNGLVPVIIQDYYTLQVLMLGYMNEESYQKTVAEQRVTFYSRTKQRLWTKGETSGNFLLVKEIKVDCDHDTLLIFVEPQGVTCHQGTQSCFATESPKGFLYQLEHVIAQRIAESSESTSYTKKIFDKGINKMAQKVGEEAVELVIEAKDNNIVLFKNEAADLLYHFLILLKGKEVPLSAIEQVLVERHNK